MAILKNLPTEEPKNLSSLLTPKQNQIVSMALSDSEDFQLSVLTFADQETVSEEEYFGDTMYFVLEGETFVTLGEKSHLLKTGDVFKVNAHVLHAIGGKGKFKVMQLTVKE